MIGKAAWFQRRKYGGWGLSPKTWQGWVFSFAIAMPIAFFQALPFWSDEVRIAATFTWVALIVLEALHIMTQLETDEREFKIEAISERNSAWAMVFAIFIGITYQAYQSTTGSGSEVDPFLFGALGAGVIVKAISNIYYSHKSL